MTTRVCQHRSPASTHLCGPTIAPPDHRIARPVGFPCGLQRYVRLDGLDGLDAIWISHLHADHRADLLTACHGALSADVRLAAPIPLHGPPGMPAFALRADAGGRSMVYSGDTAPRAALTGLAADGDLLLCEAEAVARAASRFAGPVGHADPGAVLTV